jgi:hypothetical protein
VRRWGLAAGLVLLTGLVVRVARTRVDLEEGPAGYVVVLLVFSLTAALLGLVRHHGFSPRACGVMARWGVVWTVILLAVLAAMVVSG